MRNATRTFITILLPATLAGMPMTGTAEGAAAMFETSMRAEQLQEIRSNIRASLVPSMQKETERHANRRTSDNSRDPEYGRRGVIEIIPFPQKRVSFTP